MTPEDDSVQGAGENEYLRQRRRRGYTATLMAGDPQNRNAPQRARLMGE